MSARGSIAHGLVQNVIPFIDDRAWRIPLHCRTRRRAESPTQSGGIDEFKQGCGERTRIVYRY